MRVFAQTTRMLHKIVVTHGYYLSLNQADRLAESLAGVLELADWQRNEVRYALTGTVKSPSAASSGHRFDDFFYTAGWTPADLRAVTEAMGWLFADAEEGPQVAEETRRLTDSYYVVTNLNRGFLTVYHKVYRKGSF